LIEGRRLPFSQLEIVLLATESASARSLCFMSLLCLSVRIVLPIESCFIESPLIVMV
jgi:hypothetical protein